MDYQEWLDAVLDLVGGDEDLLATYGLELDSMYARGDPPEDAEEYILECENGPIEHYD